MIKKLFLFDILKKIEGNFWTKLFDCKCYRSSIIVTRNIGTGVVVSTGFKPVRKQGIADTPVHINGIFRKLAQFRNYYLSYFMVIWLEMYCNFTKKLTHVYFIASQLGTYIDIVTNWTIENKEGVG